MTTWINLMIRHRYWVMGAVIQDDAISSVTTYMKPLAPELFAEFGLPLTILNQRDNMARV
jgi:hypothetical protein